MDPGRISLGLDVLSPDRDEYLFSNLLPTIGLIPGGNINLTRLRPSGDIVWSKDYLFESQVTHGNLTPWPERQAYLLSGLSHEPDTAAVGYLVKVQDISGVPLWSKKIPLDGAIYLANGGESEALVAPGGKLVMGMGASSFTQTFSENNLCMVALDTAGNFSWGNNYCFSCLGPYDATMGNFIPVSDGGYLFCGSLQYPGLTGPGRDILLMKVDSVGLLQWAKGYDLSDSTNFFMDMGAQVAELPNGHFAVVGQTINVLGGPNLGVVMETDSAGLFVRARHVSLPPDAQQVLLKHLAPVDSDRIVVQATSIGPGIIPPYTENNLLFQVSLGSGQVDWQYNYFTEILSDGSSPFDGFSPLPGGYAMVPNFVQIPTDVYSWLIVTDLDGRTACQTPVSLLVEADSLVEVTDYFPEIKSLQGVADFPVTAEDFEDYTIDIPILDLGNSEFFCEPTFKTLDATVPGAESYLWSTEATTPVIVAEVPGTYFVEDTSHAECWILRDTISFQILPPPNVGIGVDTTGFCESGIITLIAGAIGAETLTWSTGETSGAIQVTAAGTYSLTGVNMCGTTTATLTLTLPDCTGQPADCRIEFPNAFTPDGDGLNDKYKPLSDCEIYAEYRFRIYSRWGQLVYESTDPSTGWDGNYEDKPMPSDLFAWILEYRFPNEEEPTLEKGEVTLLR